MNLQSKDYGFKPSSSTPDQKISQLRNKSVLDTVGTTEDNVPVPQSAPMQKDYGFTPFSEKTEQGKLQELQDEDFDPEIERHVSRLTSRGIEQVVGFPGNMRDFAYAINDTLKNQKPKIQSSLEKVSGKKLPKQPESFKQFDEAVPIAKTVTGLLNYLPTSSSLKKKSGELTKGYTDPKGNAERIGDEVWENIVSSSLPGQGPKNVWRNIAAPIVSTLGKEAVKDLGGSEKSQALTQFGLNLAIPLMGVNAPGYVKNLRDDVMKSTPKISVNTNQLIPKAHNLKFRLEQGLGSNSENRALTTLNNLTKKIEIGNISADELVRSNISLNEIVGDPALYGQGRHWFDEMRGMIQDGMKEVGKQNPEWYQNWKNWNESYGAVQKSNYVANVVRNHMENTPLMSEGARSLFGAAAHGTAKAAAALPPVYAVYKGTQVLHRMAKSPTLMRYYTDAIGNILKGNIATGTSNLNKLDEALFKEEQEAAKIPFKTSSQKKSSPSKK